MYTKNCNKCKVKLHTDSFEVKRTGQLYKSCNKCRNVPNTQTIDIRQSLNIICLSRICNMNRQDIIDLRTRVADLEVENGMLIDQLIGYEDLETNGYVYQKKVDPTLVTISELMIMAGVHPDFFDLRKPHGLTKRAYDNKVNRRYYFLGLSSSIAKQYKQIHGRCSQRGKARIPTGELVKGKCGMKNYYVVDETLWQVREYLDTHPIPKIINK